ncbi:hypothetical protein N2152v2_008615 [Parachlorella kessleri]
MKAITVAQRGMFNNKFGNFAMKDWIGRPFGIKVCAKAPSSGWVYLLAPTPELWTQVLRHRTQILYVADISMVCTMLELRPGSTVLESGTGSGSLTTSLARAVAPTGHVWTFEFHEQRASTAAEEFKANGLGGLVTVTQRDIEGQGFPEELHGKADALFLDLPGPWKVQRTCAALNANGFREMRTMEVLLRHYEVTTEQLVTDLGLFSDSEPAKAQQQGRQQQQQQQQQQQEQEQQAKQQGHQQLQGVQQQTEGAEQPSSTKRQRTSCGRELQPLAGAQGGETAASVGSQAGAAAAQQQPSEAQHSAGTAGAEAAGMVEAAEGQGNVAAAGTAGEPSRGGPEGAAAAHGAVPRQPNGVTQGERHDQGPPAKERRVLARPVAQGRGHTGYLTFARKAVAV